MRISVLPFVLTFALSPALSGRTAESESDRLARQVAAIAAVQLAVPNVLETYRIASRHGARTVPFAGRLEFIDNRWKAYRGTFNADGVLDPDREVRRLGIIVSRLGHFSQSRETCLLGWRLYVHKTTEANVMVKGCTIVFLSGMFEWLKTDDAVAAVIGHEMGHVIARHKYEKLRRTREARWTLGATETAIRFVTSNKEAHSLLDRITSTAEEWTLLADRRQQELEADRIGIMLAAEAGYDPRTIVDVFLRRPAEGGFFSDHPTSFERVGNLKAHLPEAMRRYTQSPWRWRKI